MYRQFIAGLRSVSTPLSAQYVAKTMIISFHVLYSLLFVDSQCPAPTEYLQIEASLNENEFANQERYYCNIFECIQ
jgi:hypothetical protein